MKKNFLIKTAIFIFLTVGLFYSLVIAAEKSKEIVIITNANSPLPQKTSIVKIKNIYILKTKFENKTKLIPVNQNGNLILSAFTDKFINMTLNNYKDYLMKLAFAEGATPPKGLKNSEDVIKFVAENEGAIGYVWKDDLTGKEEGIKEIEIEK